MTTIRCVALAQLVAWGMAASSARAWDPPDGPDLAHANNPDPPTALVRQVHGYIIQHGITLLNNDGYWFAAKELRDNQADLLSGVRYADVYQGRQAVSIRDCVIATSLCTTIDNIKDWPYAADNHYFNPKTGLGLQTGALTVVATWGPFLATSILNNFTLGVISLTVVVDPQLDPLYASALSVFDTEYATAVSAFTGGSPTSIGGRQGTALGLFYLGWASHLMQDQFVVHHTMDEVLKHHSEYEAAADGLDPGATPILQKALYDTELATFNPNCPTYGLSSRTCFAETAARTTNWQVDINAIDNGDYSSVVWQTGMAARFQAGLYYAFFTDVGKTPVSGPALLTSLPTTM